MAFNLSGAVTGATVTGLTSPTYTPTADTAPNINGKQWAVTALGGTQTGVDINSVSKPFTVSFFRPLVLKTLPPANPVTGLVKNVPVNTYKHITRKGVTPGVNVPVAVARITTTIEVPAGADSYDLEDLKAMISCHYGAGWAQAAGIADTIASGII